MSKPTNARAEASGDAPVVTCANVTGRYADTFAEGGARESTPPGAAVPFLM
jgi:hypothetical protein